MNMLYIYDNAEISISITAKNEKEAYKILKDNVLKPEQYTMESELDINDLTID